MILTSTKTMWGISLNMAQLMGIDYNIIPNTTLNEKFDILAGEVLPSKTYPTMKYMALGVGGIEINAGTGGYVYSNHSAADGALFQHIPWVVREVTEDLLPEEREKYRFRVTKNVGGVDYYFYYLKLIETIDHSDRVNQVRVVNDVKTLSTFNTDTSDILNPTPRLNDDITNIDDNSYLVRNTKISFILSTGEIQDIMNAMELTIGSIKPLTEIGLCTGIDRNMTDYTEAGYVEINQFVTINLDLQTNFDTDKPVERVIEIGGSEPLLA